MNISVERGVMARRRQLSQKKYILAMLIRFVKMEIININAKLVFSTLWKQNNENGGREGFR